MFLSKENAVAGTKEFLSSQSYLPSVFEGLNFKGSNCYFIHLQTFPYFRQVYTFVNTDSKTSNNLFK